MLTRRIATGEMRMTKEPAPSAEVPPGGSADSRAPLERVQAALAALQFGTIQITVHNGKPVQLDVTERHRFQG